MSAIFNTTSDISQHLGVNEKKAKEVLLNGIVPCTTTGTDKRKRYYTTEFLIGHAHKMIERYRGMELSYKEAFLSKDINSDIHKASDAHECEVITVTNLKGGVGKTTDSVNIAVALAKLGQRVLIVDMDSQSQSSRYFKKVSYKDNSLLALFEVYQKDKKVKREDIKKRIVTFSEFEDGAYSIDILPSEIRLAKMLELMRMQLRPEKILSLMLDEVKDDYDYIIIDTPPYSGLSLEMSLYATNKVILATEAEEFSVEGMEVTIEEIRDLNKSVEREIKIDAIFVNSYTNHKYQEEALGEILDILEDDLALESDDSLFVVKSSPTVVSTSQAIQLPIIEYKKKMRLAISISEPMFSYAAKLISHQKQPETKSKGGQDDR